jgi:hypothetical protein
MFEPGVVRAWIDEIREPELTYVPEPLERRSIEEPPHRLVHLDIPVHGVLDDLHGIRTLVAIKVYRRCMVNMVSPGEFR